MGICTERLEDYITAPCYWCGKTTITGGQVTECGNCRELREKLMDRPEITMKMIKAIAKFANLI